MVDTSLQRKNMVESQVRPSDITDRRIMRSMLEVPREQFVDPAVRAIAYMDEDAPISAGDQNSAQRYLLAPRTLAKLLQLANISNTDVVLDVACATGYSAAVLSSMCGAVVAVEPDAELAQRARQLLEALLIDNVIVVMGEAALGASDEAPFDAIVVQGLISVMPPALLNQLKDGGRLVALNDDDGVTRAVVWSRVGTKFDRRPAFEMSGPRLAGFERPQTFAF
ncbi:MAG: protein-L-isoaspartate O-methyltransferase [Pseudomonadota bacterium]